MASPTMERMDASRMAHCFLPNDDMVRRVDSCIERRHAIVCAASKEWTGAASRMGQNAHDGVKNSDGGKNSLVNRSTDKWRLRERRAPLYITPWRMRRSLFRPWSATGIGMLVLLGHQPNEESGRS
jgi:hypothetical protein